MNMAGNRNKEIGSNFDVEAIRDDFPILSRTINGKKLIYADNAATTQKPTSVMTQLPNITTRKTAIYTVAYTT